MVRKLGLYIHLLVMWLWVSAQAASPDFDRYTRQFQENESLPAAVKELIFEEQVLHNKSLWGEGAFDSNINPRYIPDARPVFPLSYFLIPADDANFLKTAGIDPRVLQQISQVGPDGKRFYKMLIHPESYQHYKFLEGVYQYVGPEHSEFLATPTSSFRSLVVWNKSGRGRVFIAKVSLDRNVIGSIDRLVSVNEVERSVANQEAFEKIGNTALRQNHLDIFPETAGLTLAKSHPGAPEKLGGMLIREIPDSVVNGQSRWVSFSALMSPNRRGKPLIMDVIKKSGLSSNEFIERHLIDGYMQMFEQMSLKTGLNFEPHSQNLCFELTSDLRPTGNWVIRDFGGVWPDLFTMMKNRGPVEAYLKTGSAQKYKLEGGHSNAFASYAFFYKRQVFDMILTEIAKYDRTLNAAAQTKLKLKIDTKMAEFVFKYLIEGKRVVPNMENYKQLAKERNDNTSFKPGSDVFQTRLNADVREFIRVKTERGEWVKLSIATTGNSILYLTSHAAILTAPDGRILGIGPYNQQEFKRFAELKSAPIGLLRESSSGQLEHASGGIGTRCLTILRGLFAQ